MKFNWVHNITTIEVVLQDGRVLDFSGKIWKLAKIDVKVQNRNNKNENDEISPCVFNVINNWLSFQPEEKLNILSECYLEIHNILDYPDNVSDINYKLSKYIQIILDQIPWEEFHRWCIESNELNFSVGIKETLGEKDSADITYFTKDYQNLVILSVVLKLILPIWGSYYNALQKNLDPTNIFIQAVDLIKCEYMEKNPGFTKLQHYVYTRVSSKGNIYGFSINRNISTDEIPEHMFSLVMWKKICVFDGKGNGSIIDDAFNLLKDKCDRLVSIAPLQKKMIKPDASDMSIPEVFKIVQLTNPSEAIIAECYIQSDFFIEHINVNIEKEEVINKIRYMPELFLIQPFHKVICGLVCGIAGSSIRYDGINCNTVISVDSLDQLDLNTLKLTIVVCSLALFDAGYECLSELLLAVPTERDRFSISSIGVKPYKLLTENHYSVLEEQYKFCNGVNKALISIENIVKEVNSYNWPSISNLENLQIELANLIIQHNIVS